ncbi:MAG: cation:proton antiporter [Fibrobacterota bacterium]
MLVIQVGIIILAARAGGAFLSRFRLPRVLGEILVGIIIGPHLLGGIGFWGFPEGIFALQSPAGIPISTELYGLATIASILLLFMAGLGTDLNLFLRYSLAGSLVGLGSAVLSFAVGAFTAIHFLNISLSDPLALFLGVLCTATSVDITVRILSENKKLDSPEGVTILSGAVIDDIISIILLTIITGYALFEAEAEHNWNQLFIIGGRAVAVWVSFTALGIIFSDTVARLLKLNKIEHIAVSSLGLALILAGIFEKAGLAMIIGAYIMGLSISKTDLDILVQEKLRELERFFDPIFFVTIGMFVDVTHFFQAETAVFGLVFAGGAVVAKFLGAGIPSLFLNFNFLGASRIGLGMVPRGEVALIIAGIGLSSGILTPTGFSVSVMMALISTLTGPVLLEKFLKKEKRGIRNTLPVVTTAIIPFDCGSRDLADFVERFIMEGYKNEGFYVNRVESEQRIYRFQRGEIFITLYRENTTMNFETNTEYESLVRNMLYETIADLSSVIITIKDLVKPEDMKRDFAQSFDKAGFDMTNIFRPELIEMNLVSQNKEGVIEELIQILYENGVVADKEAALQAVWHRENAVSTGMENGVALPHGRLEGIHSITSVIGISRTGIDFGAMDNKPSKVFVLTLVPAKKQVPYVQFLAAVSSALNGEEKVSRILQQKTKIGIIDHITGKNPAIS